MKKRMVLSFALAALIIGTLIGCSASAQVTAQSPAQTGLTKEQAEVIALEHAGLTADQVKRLRTEYEIDDGIPRYEVQFRYDRWEYDYEINAENGNILSFDRDD